MEGEEGGIVVVLLVLPVHGTRSLLPRVVQRLSADVALELRLRGARGGLDAIAAVHGGSRHGGASGGEGPVL
jgi:CelD/BcsL family acetyltransferase involved in cellulose biosynthesis